MAGCDCVFMINSCHHVPAQQKLTNYCNCDFSHYFVVCPVDMIPLFCGLGWTNYSQPIINTVLSVQFLLPGCWSDFLFSCCPWATKMWTGSNETQLNKLITQYLQFIPQVAVKILTLINSVSRGHLPNPDYMLTNVLSPTVPMQFHTLSILLSVIGCMWQFWK